LEEVRRRARTCFETSWFSPITLQILANPTFWCWNCKNCRFLIKKNLVKSVKI